MSPLEKMLRRAYAEASEAVTPADVPAVPRALRTDRGWRRPRRRRLAFALLASGATGAVAVAAAVIGTSLPPGARPSPVTSPSARSSASALLRPPGAAVPAAQPAPRFFAVLGGGPGRAVDIRSAATGAVIDQLKPPAPDEFFSGVAAAAPNGRTLLLAVEHNAGACETWLYQVRLNRSGHAGKLRPAATPSVAGILPDRGFAASFDGSAVALYADDCNGSGSLEIIRSGTGAPTLWSGEQGDSVLVMSLSASGSVLGFSGYEYAGPGPGAKPGTSSVRLRAVAAVLPVHAGVSGYDGSGILLRQVSWSAISPNGTILYVCTAAAGADTLTRMDVATRKSLGTVAHWPGNNGGCSFTLDANGRDALLANVSGHAARLALSTGRMTALPAADLGPGAVLAW